MRSSRVSFFDASEAVDAEGVVVGDILAELVGGLIVGPLVERVSVALVFVERDAIPAGVGDACELNADDGARLFRQGEVGGGLSEVVVVRCEGLALSIEAEDSRRSLEGAEHDGDAFIFLDMSDGFDAGSDAIDISDIERV